MGWDRANRVGTVTVVTDCVTIHPGDIVTPTKESGINGKENEGCSWFHV